MKILMVGALYFANFGDLLFSKLFYEELLKKHDKSDIYIYETPVCKLNEACRKELSYENHFRLSMLKDMDALVYISGGYFDVRKTSHKAHFDWYMKYALPGEYMAKHGKKIYVLGVGGGDFVWKRGEKVSRQILDAAQVVCVRNKETKQKLEKIGVNNNIIVHSDTAQAISNLKRAPEKKDLKKIFLHVIPTEDKVQLMMKNVIPAVKTFVNETPGYKVVVGYDGIVRDKYKDVLKNVVSFFGNDKAEFYDYTSIDSMIKNLSECDVVVTAKLHAGIVGSSLGKSVFVFPVDYNKTHRYYEDIGYPERCFDLNTTTQQQIVEALKKYSEEGVSIPQDKIDSARSTLQICADI